MRDNNSLSDKIQPRPAGTSVKDGLAKYRWTALLGAAVLTLASPVQVLADEIQGGSTIETAVTVPSLSVEEEVKTVVVPGDNSGGGSVAAGTSTVVFPAEAVQSGSGSISVPAGITEQGADGSSGTVSAGTQPSGGLSGAVDPGQPGNVVTDAGTAESTQTVENTGVTAAAGTNTETNKNTPKDYSLGPGFFLETEEKEEEEKEEAPVAAADPLPVANPVQILPSQPIHGIMAQDGTVALADVVNSIVQVSDKYSYEQMILDMSLLKVRYGDKIHIQEIGESLDNRKLYDCIIGNVNAPKHILIQAGIHAREYMNPLMLMQQMELILANYDTGSFHGMPLTEMFNYVAVHFVPMTNPDGITISQFGPEGIRSEQLRKEINDCYFADLARGKAGLDTASYYSRWKANARGVDLNLNFDALWEEIGGGMPSSNNYRGTAPASEPETQALVSLYNNPSYSWTAVLNYHSMGNVIYWDIRGNKVQPQSRELAELMSRVTGGYRILPSTGGGGYKDWIQLSEHPVASVTLETGGVTCPIPVTYYGGIWTQNCLTWAYAMEWAAIH